MKYAYLLALGAAVFIGGGCVTEEGEEIDYEEDVYGLIEEIDEDYQVRGSCNAIETHSTCVDYVGSYWETSEYMKLNCEGVGTFSEDSCPYSELGGCRATPGTMFETIAWSYGYGGQPISEEDAQYQAMACNALETGAWTTPDELFLSQ